MSFLRPIVCILFDAFQVTSYILLRNVSGMLRTRFSSFFAWFGQFWVELLVGQYHIWMGADGHGVLVLVPAYPVRELNSMF